MIRYIVLGVVIVIVSLVIVSSSFVTEKEEITQKFMKIPVVIRRLLGLTIAVFIPMICMGLSWLIVRSRSR